MTNRIYIAVICLLTAFSSFGQKGPSSKWQRWVSSTLEHTVIEKANWALTQTPVTVTSSRCERSAGGVHDFYSEGDYWWPNPQHPDSPYIQKDGLSNPANFTAHRLAMIQFSEIVGSLASAYKLTNNSRYAVQALAHAKAWFIDSATRMNPHLLYAQAIKGRATGRGIGIIDAIHLMEVVKGLELIEKKQSQPDTALFAGFRNWFAQYLEWVTTHKYGLDEMNAANNHGTCWVMQVAVFSSFTKNYVLMERCRRRFCDTLLPNQMAADGSFPLELKRTKPYGYSIFNLDAIATICQALSTPQKNLWQYQTADGRSVRKAVEFLYPYIADKSKWPFNADIMYWDDWPVAQPFLVFAAMAFEKDDWLKTWRRMDHSPHVEEVIRNLPVRNPLLWY